MREHKELSPQHWQTDCLICGRDLFAPVRFAICNNCGETSAIVDYIMELREKLAAYESRDAVYMKNLQSQADAALRMSAQLNKQSSARTCASRRA